MTGAVRAADAPAPVTRREGLALAGMLAAGFALRAWTALTAYCSTFDSATVGLMALNILKGERPLFFYGQTYFGGFESYLAAGLFALFGASEFTLSLSAVLFSLAWITATWALFRELYGPVVAFAAALTIALPGWDTLWYGVATYGGYPAAFFLGTTALWLCARIWRRDLEGRALWAHTLALGLVAGLALWTHFIAAAYLLAGAGFAAAHLGRRRFAARVLVPFAAALAPFLVGFLPVLLTPGALTGGENVSRFDFAPGVLLAHLESLFQRPLRSSLFTIWEDSSAARKLLRLAIAASAILFVLRVREARGTRARLVLLLPLAFGAVFLLLYVPHAMAALEAPRYVIPLWTILFAALVAVPVDARGAALRRTATALFAAWMAFHAVSDVCAVRARAPRRAEAMKDREQVVAAARELGVKTAVMAGPSLFGHQGQVLSFAARGEIAFVNAYDERHRPSAARAEADDRAALAVDRDGLAPLLAALADLGVKCRATELPWISLVTDLVVPPADVVSVPASLLRAKSADGRDARALLDRSRASSLTGGYGRGRGFTVELDRLRDLAGLWMIAPDDLQEGLPSRFAIHASADGRTWTTVRPPTLRTAVGYACGPRVYVKGYMGRSEVRFPPVPARFVSVEMLEGQRHRAHAWSVAEAVLFERTAALPSAAVSEVRKIEERLVERRVRFVAADRWVSGQMAAGPWQDDLPSVFPVPNPKYPDTMVSRRIVPAPGVALVADRAVVAETETVLRASFGDRVAWDRSDFGRYAVLCITRGPGSDEGPAAPVEWYAGMLLHSAAPPPAPDAERTPARTGPPADRSPRDVE